MRTYFDCIPCFLRQALDACRMVTRNPEIHERVLRETLRLTADMPFDRSPPWMGQQIHRLLREATGNGDPYREAKRWANDFALRLRPELERCVIQVTDPFATALRLTIAGNTIDLGCKAQVTDAEIHSTIDDALTDPLEPDVVGQLRAAIQAAREILYLADNAGEIVFDRLLIERLPAERVTVAVRGEPVINDALREDAEAAGLTELVRVIDNGSDVPGTILEDCSPAFRQAFDRADLVIAKGQGNYETLGEMDHNIYFLLQAKCPVIARHIGCQVGQAVLCPARQSAATRAPLGTTVFTEGENP